MQYTYFIPRNTTKLTTRGGTSPDGVEMTLIQERESTHRLGTRLEAYACCTYYSPNPRLSVLFTHPTPVSPCLAQRGSDMRGSTVLPKSNLTFLSHF